MADAVGGEVVKVLVEKSLSKVCKEIMFAGNIESHMKELRDVKITIQATLLDGESLQQLSESQRDVLQKLECELVKLNNFLDEKATKSKRKQLMGGSSFTKELRLFFSTSDNQLASLFREASKMKAIKSKLSLIARNHADFGTIVRLPSLNQTRALKATETGHLPSTDIIIGRDGDRDNIIALLSSPNYALKAFSIVGIGGLGKTTLAQYVFNNERVKNNYDIKIWVSITKELDTKEVLEKIVASTTKEDVRNCQLTQLQQLFSRAIGGKKFLLVLDDIVDQENLGVKWSELNACLRFGGLGSKVLITTRSTEAARNMGVITPYMLPELLEEDSWSLFQQVAITPLHDPGVEEIGREVARMCWNIPLVIRVIGGHLAGKYKILEWLAFRDDQLSNFTSYGKDILHTLKLSYDRLEASLKLCFNYCSLLSRGEYISKDRIIRMWIALGYVTPLYTNQILEDAGEIYLLTLQNRGFF